MKTAFIIRMHYGVDNPKWKWRLAYFQAMVLPKILAQTDQDFDICMWVNPHHAEEVQALSPKIKIFNTKGEQSVPVDNRHKFKRGRYFVDFIDYKYLEGLDKYHIQIGLDTDDMILKTDFISRIKQECFKTDKSLHISFQPEVFHAPTLRTFRAPVEYRDGKGSAIFALYQPNLNGKYVFAYHDSHLRLPLYARARLFIDEGYCAYSVHECNESTYLLPHSKQIML